MAHTVRHSLDQHWARILKSQRTRRLGGRVHRCHIIAIHPHRVHAVPYRPGGDAIPPVLLVGRRADSVAVVAAKEDNRHLERPWS